MSLGNEIPPVGALSLILFEAFRDHKNLSKTVKRNTNNRNHCWAAFHWKSIRDIVVVGMDGSPAASQPAEGKMDCIGFLSGSNETETEDRECSGSSIRNGDPF